jgi:hypothetical protein
MNWLDLWAMGPNGFGRRKRAHPGLVYTDSLAPVDSEGLINEFSEQFIVCPIVHFNVLDTEASRVSLQDDHSGLISRFANVNTAVALSVLVRS